MATINRDALAQQIAGKLGCTQAQVRKTLNVIFDEMREHLIHGNRIEIRHFSVFSVKMTPPRPSAHNPRTGEQVYVSARKRIHFKPGKVIKQVLSQPFDSAENLS